MPFNQFIGQAKKQLIYANKVCKQYFTKKFIDPHLKYGISTLTYSGFILNDQTLALLQMSSPDFNRIKQLDLKFSSAVGYDDLEHITEIIIESQQPLLFIFRNREDESQNDTFQQQIFGAYISIDQTIETHFVRKQQKDLKGQLDNPNDKVSLYFGDKRSFLFILYYLSINYS